jgi:hypothetical protein
MRKSTSVAAPLFVVTLYYALCFAAFWLLMYFVPELDPYLPVGGIEDLLQRGQMTLQEVEIVTSAFLEQPRTARLALAIVCAILLMTPVTWIYFITTGDNRIDRSFAQTMLLLPIIVAGIATIVQNSLPLAFSLAGVVAAVRFRFTLDEPAHTLYIFGAITIGLGAGISAIGISAVVSIGFVYATLMLWRLDYGRNLNSPFFSFLTGRDHQDDDL